MIISPRFKNDGVSELKLNDRQKKFKEQIIQKIKNGTYQWSQVNCVVCDDRSFEQLSEKDRYGLEMSVVICKKCGLVQTNPRMRESDYEQFYTEEYRNLYDSGVDGDDYTSQYDHGKQIYEFIKRNSKTLELVDSLTVFEVGCGSGGILGYFKDQGHEVFGVDLDERCVNQAKKRGINVEYGTIENLSKMKKPDLIIYSHALEHVYNPVQELSKISELLSEHGQIYIEVPGIMHLDLSYEQNFLKYLQNAHLYHFTRNTLCNCARRSGLEIVSGNEMIQSLFKKDSVDQSYTNEFSNTVDYLMKLENKTGIQKAKNSLTKFMIKSFHATRTTKTAQSLYSRVKTKK